MPVTSIDAIQTFSDAKTFVSNANNSGVVFTKAQLQQIISKMNGKVANSVVTLIYSGDIVIGKNPDGSLIKIKSWQAAEAIGANSSEISGGKVATIGQTDIGKLIDDLDFRQAVINTATSVGTTPESLLFGQDANGNRINSNSLNDFASKSFISQAEGKLQIMAGDILPNSVLAKTEFPEAISSGKITEIDGISKTDITTRFNDLIHSGNSVDNAVGNIMRDITRESYVNTAANIKLTPPSSSTTHVSRIDTGNFFGGETTAPHINTITQGALNTVKLSEWFDATKLSPVEGTLGKLGTAGEVIKNMITDQSGSTGSIADLANYLHTDVTTLEKAILNGTVKAVGAIGVAAIIADIYNTSATARVQLDSGNVAGAMQSVEALSARVGLGIVGAEAGWIAGLVAGGAVLAADGAIITAGPLAIAAGLIAAIIGGGIGAITGDGIVNGANKAIQGLINGLGNLLNSAFPSGDDTSLGDDIGAISSVFNSTMTDPIVLGLNGSNIELTSLADSNAYFDLHGTGFAVRTGWVGANTGLLVNSATPTSINNLFGNFSTDGFTALKTVDSDGNNIINSNDSGFSQLYVWADANGNGVANAGEVKSLAALGIAAMIADIANDNEFLVKAA